MRHIKKFCSQIREADFRACFSLNEQARDDAKKREYKNHLHWAYRRGRGARGRNIQGRRFRSGEQSRAAKSRWQRLHAGCLDVWQVFAINTSY